MSMPLFGQEFTFRQPDGSVLKVRGFGDQHQARFETLDGYPVVEDPATGEYQYATMDSKIEELVPKGAAPGKDDPSHLGLRALRLDTPQARAAAMTVSSLPRSPTRWQTRRSLAQMAAATRGIAAAPPKRQTVGTFVGLCLLIQFPDEPGTISREEVEAFCNTQGYSGFGNSGSVYDYFRDNSGGKLQYTNIVAPYYTTRHPRSYYTDENVPQPRRAWEMIKEALAYHKDNGFDFSQLKVDDGGFVYAMNVFYAGTRVNNWAKGLWPHSYHLQAPYAVAPGKQVFDYQITDMTDELTLGTFCHENGHMICDFPDLYDYGYESNGVGCYCLMCAGGNADPKNPVQIGAYLKYAAGWASLLKPQPGHPVKLDAGKNEFFIHRKNATEYFLIENRQRSGRDNALTDAGLAVWLVDELGSNDHEQMAPSQHYECSLKQADGRTDLEDKANMGDSGDLFAEGGTFSDSTQPNAKWWDGSPSGLHIANISAVGQVMTFQTPVPSASIASGPAGARV